MAFHYREVTRSPLADYVECVWISEGYVQTHAHERLMPSGTMNLIIDVGGSGSGAMGLSGPTSRSIVVSTAQQRDLVGIRFKPGGGFAFARLPAGELQDVSAPLELLWGAAANDLRDRLLEARTPVQRFAIIEACLLARLRDARNPVVPFAVSQLQTGAASVADVAARTGYSARRFIAIFRDEVGLAPKQFQRIARFGRALGAVDGTSVDWMDVALKCGYFDQAHLIHEFRELSGVTPTAYVRGRVSANHVRLSD
jgi:AraC-like DNA-binding protein